MSNITIEGLATYSNAMPAISAIVEFLVNTWWGSHWAPGHASPSFAEHLLHCNKETKSQINYIISSSQIHTTAVPSRNNQHETTS